MTRAIGILVLFVSALIPAVSAADPPPASGMVASGTTLTVTTANAVATFNGADLVGFVNSLTNESYLKKPSGGDFAVVDLISPTGQTLQISNWSVGTEQGTGLPLATITAQDSARTFTMTVKIDPASQEIVLRTSASVSAPGVRGASWSIAGLDLAGGHWIVPGNAGSVFDRHHAGINAFLQYPNTWQAQMAVYEAASGSFLVYSTDSQFYSKDLRQTSRGDDALDMAFNTEAVAPFPSATTVPAVEWRLKAFAGDWRVAAQPYRDWMLANRPPVSNSAHPWVSNIRTVVGVGGQDSTILAPLAALVDPSQTMLYMIDWRKDAYDVNYPDYTPGPGTAAFVAAAHALGFKVMLHTDLIGVSPNNPDYATVQQYQVRAPESLQLQGWLWDQPPSTPNRYGVFDPAAAAFRSLWIARIGAAVTALSPDALHLDFSAIYNDGNGPIEGRTFAQGADLFNQQIIAAFPNLALGSEEEYDITYRYHSFAQAGMWAFSNPGHPIVTFLFNPQILHYGHLDTPQPTDPTFKSKLALQSARAVFPKWQVWSTADLDGSNPDNARFIAMVQSWQSHRFQPAWTADWTGALVRYEGLSGSSATLTDTGQVMTLTAAQSTLFQLVHDANQVATGSFISRWPAFDATTLYGLDPAQLYFVDSVPRPNSTHATSLPAGVRVGPGTIVGTSFAHFEVEPAAASGFDFFNLSNVRLGVAFQGVETPLGNGAAVNAATRPVGGANRSGLLIRPPFQAQIGGEAFAEYAVPVPAGATLRFTVGVPDDAPCTDGVTFRVTANGTELWQQNLARTESRDVILSLAAFAGSTVALRLISNPGPAGNPGCDAALWIGMTLSAAIGPISVPVTIATGSTFSGIDGASYSPASPTSGTVNNVSVPGGFTIFTQPGSTVSSGTNLATLPFEGWQWPNGDFAQPGTPAGAVSVGSLSSGGVTKNPGIFAHPPYQGRTMLSWVLRLPASPLRLDWSAGILDGASSSDGVDFEVRINGTPYWRLTKSDNHWTPGSIDLARWKGQSILVELTTDSRAETMYDWAVWADLVLSASTTTCSYGVPSSASIAAIGGSFTANITATATCTWSPASNVPWLTVVSGSGNGNGAVTYNVAPNLGVARSGTLTIGGQTLTVTQAPAFPVVMHADFNGDGKADLLWRNSAGAVTIWLMNGTQVVGGGGVGAVDLSWQIVGTGDYNGDGKADLLWRNTAGAITLWFMSGSAIIGSGGFGVIDPAWQIVGSGDYNGDGKADFLWRNTATGEVAIWLMNGATIIGGGGVGAVDLSWQIGGSGDYNGDGKADLLWRNTAGAITLWFMNGNAIIGSGGFGVIDPAWQLIGSADFNGDGKADFLWRHTGSGVAVIWLMNGATIIGGGGAGAVDLGWQIVGTGDHNGDGKADLLWRQSASGTVVIWFMNGNAPVSGGTAATIDPSWQIIYTP